MLKYLCYLLFFLLISSCGSGNPPPPLVRTPAPHQVNSEQCFYARITNIHVKNYELFLSEAPQSTCCKTGGQWGVNKQICAGTSACKNWTGTPGVEIYFDLRFTKIHKFHLTPRGSGGAFTGNSGQQGMPLIFQSNAIINPQNEDRGWNAQISGSQGMREQMGNIEFYCEHCNFNENRDMSIKFLYRGQPIGNLTLNPKSTTGRCQSSATTTPPVYPTHNPYAT